MQKIPHIVLALLSALLLSISWFSPFTIFIFIAWVPLLLIESAISEDIHLKKSKLKIINAKRRCDKRISKDKYRQKATLHRRQVTPTQPHGVQILPKTPHLLVNGLEHFVQHTVVAK